MIENTLGYLSQRFNLDLSQRSPIEISGVNRTMMAKVLGELGFKYGVEVGVAQGNHARVICENIPGVALGLVDVWGTYDGYREYTDRIDKYYQKAIEQLEQYQCSFIRKFSMDAVKDFQDNSLDFVYIDGAHDFKNVAMDVCEWSKKVRVGGIVFGHDFKRATNPKYPVDVKDVIPGFCYAKKIKPWFVLKNDVPDPEFGRDNPGWLFVRQETDELWK